MSVPGAEDNASMRTILRIWVHNSGNGILPGDERKAVNTSNLEVAFVVSLVSVMNGLHREDEHVEDIWKFSLEFRDRLPLNNSVGYSDDGRVAAIIRRRIISTSFVADDRTTSVDIVAIMAARFEENIRYGRCSD